MTGTECVWARVRDASWNPQLDIQDAPDALTISTTCPRCQHPSTTIVSRGYGTFGAGRSGMIMPPVTEGSCNCGMEHSDRPATDFGCGARWYQIDARIR